MNNAAASKDALNLSVGVTLTAEQVAALTDDIVWMEEREVKGEKVLVPVLYLAQADNRLAPTGALIAGNNVSLTSGANLENAGTLRASNNLSALSGKDLINSGLMQANARLDALATNNIANQACGIIKGNDVSITSLFGSVLNERTVTTYAGSNTSGKGNWNWSQDFVDNAARIEAGNTLGINAAGDFTSVGSVPSSGADMKIDAGGSVNILSTQQNNRIADGESHDDSTIRQHASQVIAGGALTVNADNDIIAVASQIEAKTDVTLTAGKNLTLASAADEDHSYTKGSSITRQEDHVRQVAATVKAGGDVKLSATEDLTMIASRIAAGDEAILIAGKDLNILAAQNSDYTLFDMKKEGGFGSKETQRDEVTQITHVGSEITTGGNLTLKSTGDQLYQAAKLDSGKDLTIDSGGSITFECVKDLHDESHIKSDNDAFWTSSKGKGNTDETLRQTQMIAKGELAIRAVDGLKIDIKEVNKQTVSQTIDAMVKADPQLAWLKEAENRGDVDWQLIKETHDAYKYSNSSLGQGAMLVIIIIVSVVTAGAASTLAASAGSAMGFGAGSTMAAATAGTAATAATATTAATAAVAGTAAGLGNVITAAALSSMASTGVVSVINNKGNIGAALGDVFSSEGMKSAVIAGLTAGFTTGVIDPQFGGTTTPFNNLTKGFDLSKLSDIGGFALHAGVQGVASGVINTAVSGGSLSDNLVSGLVSQAGNVAAAVGFYQVGSIADQKMMQAGADGDLAGKALWSEGGVGRTTLHALMGGAISSATGGDFATGAIAAGASQAMAGVLNDVFASHPELRQAASQIVGLSAAGLAGGDLEKGSWIALMADQYNRQVHPNEIPLIEKQAESLAKEANISPEEAEKLLAKALVFYTDEGWNGVLTQKGAPPDALTLKHLGIALSPLGATYAPAGSDVPTVGPGRTYTPAETVELITNYRNTHSAEYADSSINVINLNGFYAGDPGHEYANFYQDNLAVTPKLANLLTATLSGIGLGTGNALSDSFASAWGLLSDPAGTSDQLVNGIVGLSKNPLGTFMDVTKASQTKSALAILYDMQGNTEASTAIRAQSDVEFILNFLPANRARTLAELGALRKLEPLGPCCFAAGTMVSTPDGDRAIDTLKIGDIVWSKPEKGGKPFAAAILATHVRTDQPIYRLKLKSIRQDGNAESEVLMVTPSHPFYVPARRDFVPVIDLKAGDQLQSLADGAGEGASSVVESLELYLPVGKTYNLTVDVGHTFYVGKLKTWVHNTGPCPIKGEPAKGSPIPTEMATVASNGLVYKSNPKHTSGQAGNRPNAGLEPLNSIELFSQSIPSSKSFGNKEVRYAVDKNGSIHRFEGTNGEYHWNGSTGDINNPLKGRYVPNDIQKIFGVRLR
ncbi:DUF637 domain-containing protein [Pseudomonas syringae]|nr:DUF637 domain-containing protein [Pseudomonas syringae]